MTLVLYAIEPGEIPDEASALLALNTEPLGAVGVRTLVVAQRPDSPRDEGSGTHRPFYLDAKREVQEKLRAAASPQYFVLDGTGRLRHRGENLEAALRIALALSM